MSFGIVGITSNIISPNRPKTPNHWTTKTKSPQEIMKEESDRFIRQKEEKSKEKPAKERDIFDWFNVAMSGFRKMTELAEQSKKY